MSSFQLSRRVLKSKDSLDLKQTISTWLNQVITNDRKCPSKNHKSKEVDYKVPHLLKRGRLKFIYARL